MAAYSKRRRLGLASRGRGRRVRGRARTVKRRGRRLSTVTPASNKRSNAFATDWQETVKRPNVGGVRKRLPFGALRTRLQTRRKFAGSTTVVKATRQLQRVRDSFGPGQTYKTDELLKMSVPWRILRFQGMKADDTQDGTDTASAVMPGFFPIKNNLGDATSAANQDTPLYVFALNDTMQTNGTDVGQFYRMTLGSTGRVTFLNVNGTQNDGNTRSNWQVERDETGSAKGVTCKWIVNNWYDLRLKMYGCRNQQTSFYVDYVQCVTDYAGVEDEPVLFSSSSVLAEKYRDDVYGYWQDRIKSLVSNTLSTKFNPRRDKGTKPYKVLKSWRYDIKPEDSSDVDATPNAIEARIMIKDGRMCNYQWIEHTGAYDSTRTGVNTGADDFIVDPNRYNPAADNQSSGIDYRPAPKGRRYLVIRAICTKESAATLMVDNPSFDMIIRKHEQVGRSRTTDAGTA